MGELIDIAARLPRIFPVVGRIGRQDRGVFDPGDAIRWHDEELRRAAPILQHDVLAGEIDLHAWLRLAILALVRHALLADDLPQGVWVLGGGRADCQQEQQRGAGGSYHPRTPPGRRTSAPPSIMPVCSSLTMAQTQPAFHSQSRHQLTLWPMRSREAAVSSLNRRSRLMRRG